MATGSLVSVSRRYSLLSNKHVEYGLSDEKLSKSNLEQNMHSLIMTLVQGVYSYLNIILAAMSENVSSDMCAQRNFRSACAFAQSDQSSLSA